MPDDEHDKAGVVAPPPLIYLGVLAAGLLLNRRGSRRLPAAWDRARSRMANGITV
jgi:hypothetical protein